MTRLFPFAIVAALLLLSGCGNESSTGAPAHVKANLSDFGLQEYPGLVLSTEMGSNTDVTEKDRRAASVAGTTKDSVKEVVSFYSRQLKDTESTDGEGGAMLSGTTSKGANVMVMVTKNPDHTELIIIATLEK